MLLVDEAERSRRQLMLNSKMDGKVHYTCQPSIEIEDAALNRSVFSEACEGPCPSCDYCGSCPPYRLLTPSPITIVMDLDFTGIKVVAFFGY